MTGSARSSTPTGGWREAPLGGCSHARDRQPRALQAVQQPRARACASAHMQSATSPCACPPRLRAAHGRPTTPVRGSPPMGARAAPVPTAASGSTAAACGARSRSSRAATPARGAGLISNTGGSTENCLRRGFSRPRFRLHSASAGICVNLGGDLGPGQFHAFREVADRGRVCPGDVRLSVLVSILGRAPDRALHSLGGARRRAWAGLERRRVRMFFFFSFDAGTRVDMTWLPSGTTAMEATPTPAHGTAHTCCSTRQDCPRVG